MTAEKTLHVYPWRIRPAENTPTDIAGIANLGRSVFAATFALTTSPADLEAYLQSAYSYNAVERDLAEPQLQLYIAVSKHKSHLQADGNDTPPAILTDDHELSARPKTSANSHQSDVRLIGKGVTESLVGFLYLDFFPHNEPFLQSYADPLHLKRIYLDTSHHGSGLAKLMLDEAVERAKRAGKDCLWLTVLPENQRAKRFYERSGFVKVGTKEFRLGNQIDVDDVYVLDLVEKMR